MTYIQNGERWQITRGKINQVIKVSYTDLLADTELTYTGGQSGTVTAGDLYPTTEGNWFEVAASDAVDQHITTAGGVKLYEAGPHFSSRARAVAAWARMVARSETPPVGTVWTFDGVSIEYDGSTTAVPGFSGWKPYGDVTPFHFGAVGDGTTDDRAAFAAMDAYGGLVYLCKPPTRWNVSSAIELANVSVRADGHTPWDALTDGGLISWYGGRTTDEGASVQRFADRVFIGQAASKWAGDSLLSDAGTTSIAEAADGPAYLGINAQVLAFHTNQYGFCSLARGTELTGQSVISFGSGIINDKQSGRAWGFIAEIQHEQNALNSNGFEIVAKNKSTNNTTYKPYLASSGLHGGRMVAGGDNLFGGDATGPADTALLVIKNTTSNYGWNRGIVFSSDALEGTDGSAGSTGSGVAINLARRHVIQWDAPDNTAGAQITSNVTAGSNLILQQFIDNGVNWIGVNGKQAFRVSHAASGVNYVQVSSSVTGSPVVISASGDDANVNLRLQGKGSGKLQFGTHSGIGSEVVTGFIEIIDASGVARKLAVVS